jgi:hypothetical protein
MDIRIRASMTAKRMQEKLDPRIALSKEDTYRLAVLGVTGQNSLSLTARGPPAGDWPEFNLTFRACSSVTGRGMARRHSCPLARQR